MNIIAVLLLSIAILTVAIVQYKVTKTTIDRFKDLHGEIKKMESDIKKLKEQIEKDFEYSDSMHIMFDKCNMTVKGKAEYAKRVAEFLTEKVELLEKYFGIEVKETPAKPSKTEYKPIKKKAAKKGARK